MLFALVTDAAVSSPSPGWILWRSTWANTQRFVKNASNLKRQFHIMDRKNENISCLGEENENNCFYFGCIKLPTCKKRLELYHPEDLKNEDSEKKFV